MLLNNDCANVYSFIMFFFTNLNLIVIAARLNFCLLQFIDVNSLKYAFSISVTKCSGSIGPFRGVSLQNNCIYIHLYSP